MNTKHILSRGVATLLTLTPFLAHGAAQTITAAGDPTVNASIAAVRWATAANWSGAALPTASDNAIITYAGTAAAVIDIRASGFAPTGATTIQDLSFTGAGTGAVTLENNSTGSAMVLTLNGGRGAGIPLIQTGTYAVVMPLTGPGTAFTLTVQLGASGEINVGAGGLTFGAAISETGGARSLSKTGTGRLILSGANTFTGGATVTTGVLEATSNGALGSGAAVINGGTLEVNLAGAALTASSIAVNSGGQLALKNVTMSNAVTLNGGTLATRTGDLGTFAGTVNVTAPSFANLRSYTTPANDQSITISGKLTGSGALTVNGNASNATSGKALILTNLTNDYSGTFNLSAGQTLRAAPATTGNTLGTATVNLAGGTLQVRDDGTGSGQTFAYNNNVTVSASGTINVDRIANGSGNAVQFGTLGFTAGQTLTTAGANSYIVRFNGATTLGTGAVFNPTTAPILLAGIVGGAADLTKTGSGILQLNAVNSYTGQTNINAGTLSLLGSIASSPGLHVAAGATLDVTAAAGGFTLGGTQTLSGAGNVNGVVTVGHGGTLQPGDGTGAGTLTLASLALGTGAGNNSVVSFTNAATPALLSVTGVNALVANGGVNSVAINLPATAPAIGTYTLIDYAGSIGGTGFSAFHIGTAANRLVANLVNNAGNTSIDVNVTGIDFPLWKGAQSTEWSTAILGPAKNWVLNTNNATGTDFLVSDNVVFSDLATTTAVSVTVADVAPASMLFSNVTKDYVISGTKAITGTTGLTVSGGGKVTLGTLNSFTGAVALNAGITSVAVVANGGANSPLGAGTGLAFGGGTLEFTGASGGTDRTLTLNAGGGTVKTDTPLAFTGAVTGAGALTKTGNGTLTLTGVNSYAATTVSAGTLQIGNGTTNGTLGTGLVTDDGTLAFNNPVAQTVTNEITGTGGLTKTGAGNLVLSGGVANSYTGTTTVSGGNVILSKTSGLDAIGGNLVVAAGGTVSYGTTGGQLQDHIANAASITISGGTFGGGASDLQATPTAGITDTVASVTLNSGTFLSGRNATVTPFTVNGLLKITGGTALVQRGGGVTADAVEFTGGALNLDGGSTTPGQQSKLTVGAGGLTLAGTINLNAGPSTLAAGSVGSTVILNGNLASSGTSSFVRLNPTVPSASIDLGGGNRTFTVAGTLTIGTTAAPITITNGILTKAGAGALNLTGPQTYTQLDANGGVTNLHSPVGTGSATVNANATVHFYTSQTLASLTIADGVEVTFGDGLPFAGDGEKFAAPVLVPEPGSAVLLLGGSATLLGLRRRRAA